MGRKGKAIGSLEIEIFGEEEEAAGSRAVQNLERDAPRTAWDRMSQPR
jgi:hypothetical protein